MVNEKIQKFLWTVAGAEIDILKQCRTDYKKYSVIGATILMTACIAFCAGTAAAWYFSLKGDDSAGHLGWAILFGFTWAALIFCIDRSLVVTLKKDPTLKRQKFLIPLLSRAALALIIAFMVSIPLELYIFEDYIAANEENFSVNQVALLGEQIRVNTGEDVINTRIHDTNVDLDKLNGESKQLKSDIDSLQSKIRKYEKEKDKPNSPEYNAAREKYDNNQKAYKDAKANYDTEKKKVNPSMSMLELYSNQMKEDSLAMDSAGKNKHNATIAWKTEKQKKIDELTEQRNQKDSDKKKKDDSYDTLSSIQRKDIDLAQKVFNQRYDRETRKQDQLKKGNHFIRNFQILEYAIWHRDKDGNLTDTTQLLFLWLIRLFFFIVEILPTVVKIVMPIGSYDRMVYAEEEEIIKYLSSPAYMNRIHHMHDMELEAHEKQLQINHITELELKKEILEKVKAAQFEVAEATIAKWKEENLKKLIPIEEEIQIL